MVISDGQPVGPNADEEFASSVSQIKSRVHLIGLGLGGDTQHVEQYYPHAKGGIPSRFVQGDWSGLAEGVKTSIATLHWK